MMPDKPHAYANTSGATCTSRNQYFRQLHLFCFRYMDEQAAKGRNR